MLTNPATALAETLLCEREAHSQPVVTPAYQATRSNLLARLAEFSSLLLRPDDIDPDDARAVLGRATAFRLGHAATSGPNRAARLAPILATNSLLFPPIASPPGLQPIAALLSLLSGPTQELEMDELTEIVEAVQRNILSEDTEMIFGHGILPEAEEAGILAWLLVGYGYSAE
ncbi:MAG: hypothetical protein JWP58_4346 [Hymenobacter sp.]|nr:hypothetical protein [Hymenobacter sp.]